MSALSLFTVMVTTASEGFLDGVGSSLEGVGTGAGADIGWMDFTKMALALALVVGLMLGLLYLARKYLPGSVSGKNNDEIQLRAMRYLGAKKSLLVVHTYGKTLLLGLTGQSISLLAELQDAPKEGRSKNGASVISSSRKRTYGVEDEKS